MTLAASQRCEAVGHVLPDALIRSQRVEHVLKLSCVSNGHELRHGEQHALTERRAEVDAHDLAARPVDEEILQVTVADAKQVRSGSEAAVGAGERRAENEEGLGSGTQASDGASDEVGREEMGDGSESLLHSALGGMLDVMQIDGGVSELGFFHCLSLRRRNLILHAVLIRFACTSHRFIRLVHRTQQQTLQRLRV